MPTTAIEQTVAGRSTSGRAEHIQALVRQSGRRWRRLLLLEALGLAIVVPVAYLLFSFLLEDRFHLARGSRLAINAGFLACAGGLLFGLWRRWRMGRVSEDEVALAMERRTPGGVQNRLINALQFARSHSAADANLQEAVIEENARVLERTSLEQAAQARKATIRIALAAALIAVGAGVWLLQPARFNNAATRILLPLANVEPLYRTTLVVEPGDVAAAGDVTLRIAIQGERPDTLSVIRRVQGKISVETVRVDPGARAVTHVLRGIDQSQTYAVRGGDFTSPTYRIDVPTAVQLSLVRAAFRYPAYTKLPEKQLEKAGGDLEALRGTTARVTFVFDHPVADAALLIERVRSRNEEESTTRRTVLERISDTWFGGDILFEDVTGYRLETRQDGHDAVLSNSYVLRVLPDLDPKLELSGLERQNEVELESRLPLKIRATDDYGLDTVGLFVRHVKTGAAPEEWQPVVTWKADGNTELKQTHELVVRSLGASEGERLELAVRATDTDPSKNGRFATGTVCTLLVGGEGAALQIQYERLLRTEADLQALIRTQQKVLAATSEWLRKLDADAKSFDALHAAVKEQSKTQDQLRQTAGEVARDVNPQAGNLRLGLGMLADTEMVRAIRILDSVATREQAADKRTALTDAKATQERIIRSLQEMQEQHAAYRADWELMNLIPFTRMLAERQTKLAEQSRQFAEKAPVEALRSSSARRQAKVLELCRLIRPAFAGLAERMRPAQPLLADGFEDAANTLAAAPFQKTLQEAADDIGAGRWNEAVPNQASAATELTNLADRLRKAQVAAAQEALKALRKKAESDAEAQKALETLQAGNSERMVDLPAKMKIEDILHIQDVANPQGNPNGDRNKQVEKKGFSPDDLKLLDTGAPGAGQDFNILKLGSKPDKNSLSFPKTADGASNKVKPFIHEKFDDLAGKLLDEADELANKYESLTLNFAGMHGDPGEIGKQGGQVNSTSADSATGNMKPNVNHSAGVARPGRQGGRAGGEVVGDEAVNRRGRDKVLEGHQAVPDQPGSLKEKKSDDMQKDTSTGVGGKRVESDDAKFSLSDAGKWTDDMAKRLGKPLAKNSIVERQDAPLDPRIAAQMRDLESKQEQLIERLKTIKKDLHNLYLPTDHLDDLEKQLQANLASLKERPDADLFRTQLQTLDRLRGSVRVFRGANAGYQPSVPREQAVRGRVLDEAARPALPGYEEAVKEYYERLSR